LKCIFYYPLSLTAIVLSCPFIAIDTLDYVGRVRESNFDSKIIIMIVKSKNKIYREGKNMKRSTRYFFLLYFLPLTVLSQNLPEDQIVSYLKNTKNDQLNLLEKLVNINSGTDNIIGVRKVGERLRPEFEAIGFKTHWEQGVTSMKRAPTLIAERQGVQGKRLLLIGHLDTVFPEQSDFKSYSQAGNKATGPGVIDIKGGDVIILYSLKALAASKALENTTIRVVLTGDEEDSAKPTSISRKPLIDVAKKSDIALDFEPSPSRNTLSVARRGITHWTIEARGKEGHSSQIFKDKLGFGAIFELARIVNQVQTVLSKEKYLTLNPGIILGGTHVKYNNVTAEGTAFGKDNIISSMAVVAGDLRYLTVAQKNKAERIILATINQHLSGTTSSVKFEEAMPPMPPVAANLKLLNKYSQISQTLDYGPVTELPPDLRGGGDISHIAPYISAGLVGLGAVGTGEHSKQETLDVDSLVIQSQRAALLIYALTR
jgi:glutamate carboxypeptidase